MWLIHPHTAKSHKANLIYSKVDKNQILRIETIKQELCKPEKKEQQIALDDE